MILKPWEELPDFMRTPEVKQHYDILAQKKRSLIVKRIFDIVVASILLILFAPIFLVVSILVKKDSDGPIFFRQERVTQYGRIFKIHKFRTMVNNADKLGGQISTKNDARVTKVGSFLRKYKIDEFPQLIDIIKGDMTFVGTRPEVPKYVNQYTNEMYATLLLPAGVTSKASIEYKDENDLIDTATNIDEVYTTQILPVKMQYNLQALDAFDWLSDIILMIRTALVVMV